MRIQYQLLVNYLFEARFWLYLNSMYSLRIILSFLAFSVILLCRAQQPSYIQFSVNNGLPSNNVYYSIQDRNGYFWFATDKGVAKFNGYNFKVYTTNDGLSDNEIFDIYEDSKGRIWFSCYNGELCFYYKNKFYSRNNCSYLSKINRSNIGLKVLEDRKGTVYFITQRSLVSIEKDNVVSEILTPDQKAYATLFKNNEGSVFSISYDAAMVYINNVTTKAQISFSHNKGEAMPRVNTKADMIGDIVYYGFYKRIVGKDLKSTTFRLPGNFDHLVQFVKRSDEKHVWVGTQKGLHLFDVVANKIVRSIFNEASISSVNVDNEKHIWITTLDNGVYLLLNQDVDLYSQNNGLSFNYAANFFAIDSTRLLIGSRKYHYSVLTNKEVVNSELPLSQGTGLIRKVRKDRKGNVYIITAASVVKLNSKLEINDTYAIAIRDLHFVGDDSVYVARISGISKVDVNCFNREKNLDAYFSKNIKFKHPTNYFYDASLENRIYCIGNKGIKQIWNDRLMNFETDSLFINNVTDVLQDPRGILFLSSDINGVFVKYKGVDYIINIRSGLPSNFATGLTIDEKMNIWVGTAKGIAKITSIISDGSLKFEITNYNKLNGLIDNSINAIAWHGNRIYAATNFGVCSFKEDQLVKHIPRPVINIEAIQISDSVYDGEMNKEYMSKYNRNNIRIDYIAISSGSLDNIVYVYRMKGLEENWNTTQNLQLQYPSLPHGNYIFEIKALNARGDVSDVKSISIVITPAFYQTIWFRVLTALVIIVIFYLIIIYRIKVWRRNHELQQTLLESENKRLELERDEINMQMKLIELEQKALRLHMNPHFLFNAINAINGFYASGEAELGKRYITKLSQLLRMLLDYSAQKIISLKQETDLLHNYFLLNQLRFQNKFEYSIEIKSELNPDIVAIPPMIIQPFVENALIHGIAPLKTKGIIKVKVEKMDNYLVCTISDNGIGRKKSGELNGDKIHISTGIKVTEERIKSNVDDEQHLRIEDITNSEGICVGTKVVFKINYQEMF